MNALGTDQDNALFFEAEQEMVSGEPGKLRPDLTRIAVDPVTFFE